MLYYDTITVNTVYICCMMFFLVILIYYKLNIYILSCNCTFDSFVMCLYCLLSIGPPGRQTLLMGAFLLKI